MQILAQPGSGLHAVGQVRQAASSLKWSFQRTLAKANYKIHTDAIKERLIPPRLTKAQTSSVYASEADLEQQVELSNLESINAVQIHQQLSSVHLLTQLNTIAITQMRSLVGWDVLQRLPDTGTRKGIRY